MNKDRTANGTELGPTPAEKKYLAELEKLMEEESNRNAFGPVFTPEDIRFEEEVAEVYEEKFAKS